jgi:predicted  nucleic acid-binding Zn-ribbon protein
MKLAEALLLRADMKKKLASLRERIARNAVVQENYKPQEDPAKLIKEATGVLDEMSSLVLRINTANQIGKAANGRTLAELISQREKLTAQHSLLQLAVQSAHKEPDRYSMKEIKWVATLPVASLQKQSDDLSKQIRELNIRIQETNWRIDID